MKIFKCTDVNNVVNSYVLKKKNKAIVIDPFDFSVIEKYLLGVMVDFVIITHEHFDHIKDVDVIRSKYRSKVISHLSCSSNMVCSKYNLSRYGAQLVELMSFKTNVSEFSVGPADHIFEKEYTLSWEGEILHFYHTPGHSEGSCMVQVNNALFVGDSLFESRETVLRGLIGTNRKLYAEVTLPLLYSFDENINCYPGHGHAFNLSDKLKALDKAISIYKKRPKISNLYMDFSDFESLLNNCLFFIRGENLFLLENKGQFFKLYFAIENFESLKFAESLIEQIDDTLIVEIIDRALISETFLESIDCSHYATFNRFILKEKKIDFVDPGIITAEMGHLKQIKKMIQTLDPYVSYLPNDKEIEDLITNGEIHILCDDEDTVMALTVIKTKKRSSYIRYTVVNPLFQGRGISKSITTKILDFTLPATCWIDKRNIASIKMNEFVGFEKTQLKNTIFIRRKGSK